MSIADAFDRGHVSFMGIDLLVASGALVPRQETELLGETAVALLQRQGLPQPRLIDMCCGAGNLACGIAAAIEGARVFACDLTDGCVGLAHRNVAHTGLGARVSVHQGDLFAGLHGLGLEQTIDLVVCNPPYISDKRLDGDRRELLLHEPREAFAAGPYGLSIHQRVIKEALSFLRPGGWLLFEFGLQQERQLKILLERSKQYSDIGFASNAAGEPRVVTARKLASPPPETRS